MLTIWYWTTAKSSCSDKLSWSSMNLTEIVAPFLRFSLFQLYAPVISIVGFSHPITFAIITGHNMFSLSYLLVAVALAYPVLHNKVWVLPAGVAVMWFILSVLIVASLNFSAVTAVAAVLPHGWLEFFAIAYWTVSIRKAVRSGNLPKPVETPTFRDYAGAITKPGRFIAIAKTDLHMSFKSFKLSFKILSRSLKRNYLVTLILIAAAALLETFITPQIMFFVNSL